MQSQSCAEVTRTDVPLTATRATGGTAENTVVQNSSGTGAVVRRAAWVLTRNAANATTEVNASSRPAGSGRAPVRLPAETSPAPTTAREAHTQKRVPRRSPRPAAHPPVSTGVRAPISVASATDIACTALMNVTMLTPRHRPATTRGRRSVREGSASPASRPSATATQSSGTASRIRQKANTRPSRPLHRTRTAFVE
jgi:hypothetical protein